MLNQILAILFFFSPLIIYTGFAYPYSLPRWFALMLIAALWSSVSIYKIIQKKSPTKLSLVDCAFLGFIAALGLATITSIDSTHSLWGGFERSFAYSLWLALFVIYINLKEVSAKTKSYSLIVSLFLMSAWGIAQKLLPGFSQTFSGGRIGGTLGNAIFYGAYLSLTILLIGYYFFQKDSALKQKYWKIFTIISIVLANVALVLTQARGPLLSLIGGLLLAGLIYISVTLKNKKIIGSIFILAIIFGISGIFFIKNIFVTTTLETRLYNWNMALRGFKEKPILGWGPENYSLAADKYFNPHLSTYSIAETHADKPHNYFLELAVTSGLLGLLSYIVVLVIAVRTIAKLYKEQKINSAGFALLLGTLTTSVLQNITAFETHGSAILFIILLAEISEKSKKISSKYEKIITTGTALIGTISVLGFILVVFPELLNAPYFQKIISSDSYTKTSNNTIEVTKNRFENTKFQHDYFTALSFNFVGRYWQNSDALSKLSAEEKEMLLKNVVWLEKKIDNLDSKNDPANGQWKRSLADSSYQIYILTQTQPAFERAESLYKDYSAIAPDRQEPLLQLGQLALQQKNDTKSIEYLNQAVSLDESFMPAHLQRALTFFFAKKPKDAWNDIKIIIANNYQIQPKIANYIYNQLLSSSMASEAAEFKTYFEAAP